MKPAKRKIWILGIVAAAAVFAIVLLNRRGGNELTVHLVDEDTGKPLSCSVNLQEFRSTPFLSRFHFVPLSLRQSYRERSLPVVNGTFHLRRISAAGENSCWIRVTWPNSRDYKMVYREHRNGHGIIWSVFAVVDLAPGQTEVSIEVPAVARK